MAIEVFRRVEEKYILTEKQYKNLIKLCKDNIEEDEYFKSTICSIYFDNINNDLINESLSKPVYKEKIRLRSYGIPKKEDYVFLEIKKKYKGIVNKRRVLLTLNDFYNYYNNGVMPTNSQIMKEIDFCFKKYNLIPKKFVAYDRYAYREKNNKNFRFTFDYNIRSRSDELRLEYGDIGELLMDRKLFVLEVKCLDAIPIWFSKALSELKIYPSSFSKYGKIYLKERGDLNV